MLVVGFLRLPGACDMNIWFFLAAVCFALAAFNVPRLNWTAAGFCLVTVGLWLA
jgi:hypothetical protein